MIRWLLEQARARLRRIARRWFPPPQSPAAPNEPDELVRRAGDGTSWDSEPHR